MSKTFKKEVPAFKFKINPDKPEETDADNSVILYKSLKNLNVLQASDERLWTVLTHGIFYGYMQHRWSSQAKISKTNTYVCYFFAYGKKHSLITNSISKLW